MTLDEQARALAIAIMERPEGYDPALLIGFEREWYGANLPLILAALREAKAQGMEEAAKQCALGFVHPTAGANVLESRALGFEQLNIVEYWCRARAAAIRKGEG